MCPCLFRGSAQNRAGRIRTRFGAPPLNGPNQPNHGSEHRLQVIIVQLDAQLATVDPLALGIALDMNHPDLEIAGRLTVLARHLDDERGPWLETACQRYFDSPT